MKLASFLLPYLLRESEGIDYLSDAFNSCSGSGNASRKQAHEKIGVTSSMTIEERMKFSIKSEKIVGGRLVEHIGHWAFIGNLGGYCGGSIIGDTWFLTAGHCCASTPIGKRVFFGVLDPWDDKKRVERRVVEYELHPNFVRETLKNDMCVMRLDEPLDFSDTVKPICISTEPLKRNEPVFVAGWGLTEEGGEQSHKLMEVSVPVVTTQQCKDAYPHRLVDSSMVCAGLPAGGMDGCQGDSGGPLVTVGMDGEVRLAGVVSWGIGCARPGKFGVYARMDNNIRFVEWAIATMSQSGSPSYENFLLAAEEKGPGQHNEDCTLENVANNVEISKKDKKGTTTISFTCPSGQQATFPTLICDGKHFYASKGDAKKENNPLDSKTRVECSNACGDTSNSAYDKLFKKNPRENFIEGKAKVTDGGVEVIFTCNEGTMKDVDFTALCYANKKGKLATQLLGSKSEKKAFKKCK